MDRRIQRSDGHEAELLHARLHPRNRFGPHRVIAHHPALSDLRSARLELRLHQRDQHAPRPSIGSTAGSTCLSEMKLTSITTHVHRLGQVGVGSGAARSPARGDDPRVLAQLLVQLAMADVDGVDPAAPCLEQAVGEAAGARADVRGRPRRARRAGSASSAALSLSPPRET